MNNWIENNLGLSPNVFAFPEVEAFFGLYTPGFGNSDDPSMAKRNGGIIFNTRMDIPNFADGIELQFELDPFSMLNSTELLTAVIPNFRPMRRLTVCGCLDLMRTMNF